MSKPKGRDLRPLAVALAGLGAAFACLAADMPPRGVFAALSTLSWLGALYVAVRR